MKKSDRVNGSLRVAQEQRINFCRNLSGESRYVTAKQGLIGAYFKSRIMSELEIFFFFL